MNMDGKTLHEFERRLVPIRSTAGTNESWEKYAADVLPVGVAGPAARQVHQGFDAGYDAAMNRVRGLLAELQTEGLRAKAAAREDLNQADLTTREA